jgi:ParB family chromosome partitioning protein
MGHARAILGSKSAEEQLALYQRILREGMSVRKVEQLVQEAEQPKQAKPRANSNPYPAQQKQLSELLDRRVQVKDGKIVIPFRDQQDLEAIIANLH